MAGDTCDVCGSEPTLGVAAVPGVPISVAFGRKCLDAEAYPLWVMVGNTAATLSRVQDAESWRSQAAPWWIHMVDSTLTHLEVSEEEFVDQVRESLDQERRYWRRQKLRHPISYLTDRLRLWYRSRGRTHGS